MRSFALSLLAAGTMLAMRPGLTDDRPPYGQSLSLVDARQVAAAALREAGDRGWRVAVAIVDNHGELRYFEMIDDTQHASGEVAIGKARAAARYRRSTKVFQDGANKDNAAVLSLPGVLAIEGGLPIFRDEKVVGAIGVSGVTSAQDGVVAAAGASALRD